MMRLWFRHASLLLVLLLASQVQVLAGWDWDTISNPVTADSGKRSNVFFEGEPVQFHLTCCPKAGWPCQAMEATRYEVRDYYGNLVDQGAASATITPAVVRPGWYKLYLYGDVDQGSWGKVLAGTTFCIFRNRVGFPPLPDKSVASGSYSSMDTPLRGLIGAGPFRLFVEDASKPDEAISKLEGDIALDKQWYLPYDPARKRVLMCAFPNGTSDLAGVRQIVDHFKSDIKYWEPVNEPNGLYVDGAWMTGSKFATTQMKSFYETVKSVDPSLKVMGPGTVSIGPGMISWLDDFFKAGGGQYIDVFSFHAYNNVNGDIWLARKSLDELKALLTKYNLQNIEKWQTEQGYFAPVYGSYQPRLQGRWTMLQMMVFEQYGIPKEHNHYWYDRSHGFWDFPTWWENDDGGLNPAAPLLRVWSEELYGTNFVRAYDFGPNANRCMLGSLFQGGGKSVAAFMSAGSTDAEVSLRVTGGDTLHTVSAFGVEQDYHVTDGSVRLPVTELPVYVEVATGQTLDVVPENWGPNLTQLLGVTVAISGTGVHPADASIPNSPTKIINGVLENDRWSLPDSGRPWMDDTPTFPAWVEIHLPISRTIDRVEVYAFPCWQWEGTLVDYELQYDKDGQWVTIDHVQEPTKTFRVFTPPVRCTTDSFFSDRWVFNHSFAPVTTSKIRLLVHDCTWGGGATKDVVDAGGQTGLHHMVLREVEVYDVNGPRYTVQGRVKRADGTGVAGIPIRLTGLETRTSVTDQDGNYAFEGLVNGGNYTWTAPLADSDLTFDPPQYGVARLGYSVSADFVAAAVPSAQGTGLSGQYFNGAGFDASVLTRLDPAVNYDWSYKSPASGVNSNSFSVRWTGYVQPAYSERYTFSAKANDGARLWVNGTQLVDKWVIDPNPDTSEGSIDLQAGRKYDIRLDYYQFQGPGYVKLSWSSSSQPLEVIPTNRLYPAVTAVATPPLPNTPPIAVGQAVTVPMNTARAVTIAASDPDGDALAYSVVTQSAHGALSGTAPSLTYTPVAGYSGPDSFTFKANDGKADSNVATVTITVAAGNRAPVATGQTVNVEKDTAKSVSLASADPDGDALTFAIVTNPTHGTLSGTAPDVSYTPAPGYTGDDSFTFKANDGKLDSNVATISINVLEPSRTNIDIVSTGMPRKPAPGDHVQLTVSYTNTSSVDAANVDIRYPVPPHSRYVPGSATAGGVYDSQANEVRWVIPSLSAGASGSASFEIVVE